MYDVRAVVYGNIFLFAIFSIKLDYFALYYRPIEFDWVINCYGLWKLYIDDILISGILINNLDWDIVHNDLSIISFLLFISNKKIENSWKKQFSNINIKIVHKKVYNFIHSRHLLATLLYLDIFLFYQIQIYGV